MSNFHKIGEGTVSYKYTRDSSGKISSICALHREYITLQVMQSFPVFIAWDWDAASSCVCLRRDSVDSIRKTNKPIFVDLSVIVGQNSFNFIKKSIFLDTFRFPDRLQDNSLIKFACIVYEDLNNQPPTVEPVKDTTGDTFENKCSSNLKESLAKMLNEEKFADVTLECKGGNMKAHKSILSSRSEVFDRMFQTDMLETETNVVKCKFDVGTMKAMLDYMYFGKLNHAKLAPLLGAADYYGVQHLKETCEEILTIKLSPENAISRLILAHTFAAEKMKQRILEYISKNSRAVVASDGYKKASKDGSFKMSQIAWLLVNALANR